MSESPDASAPDFRPADRFGAAFADDERLEETALDEIGTALAERVLDPPGHDRLTDEVVRVRFLDVRKTGDGLAGNAFISGVARQPEAQGRMIPWLFTIVGLVEAMYFINLAFGFVFLGQVH